MHDKKRDEGAKIRRLIISGIPCSENAWMKLFKNNDCVEQRIVTFYEVLSNNYQNKKFDDLVLYVKKIILDYKPTVIILHDMGVSLGLLALIRIMKSQELKISHPKIVVFNGAFQGFNIFKANHPVRIQLMSYKAFASEVEASGGEVDTQSSTIYADICHLYRQIALLSVSTLIRNMFKTARPRKFDLGGEILILASKNDPYIPFECLKFIERDFLRSQLQTMNYGHFPYSGDIQLIRKLVDDFEKGC